MFIDRSYLTGELNVVQSDAATIERLNYFIEKYETELLKDVLGISLYKAFIAGLSASPVLQKWTDLLQGAVYLYYNRTYEWCGIVQQPTDTINAVNAGGSIRVVVGGSGAYDPVAGGATAIIPASIRGQQFSLRQRAYDELDLGSDYTISGSTLTLTGGVKFSAGDTFHYYSNALITTTASTATVKKSFIANYVYFRWMEDQATQSSTVGQVQAKTENSDRVSPAKKMRDAWNDMSEMISSLLKFLEVNKTVYTDWEQSYRLGGYGSVYHKYSKIPLF